MSSQKVIVLGTSFSSVPIYKELQSAGYTSISCGGNENDIGHLLSDEQIYIDYSEASKLIDYLDRYKRKDFFVVPSSNDIAYKTACLIKDAFNIEGGTSWDLAEEVHEKDKFKALLNKLAIPTPSIFYNEALNCLDDVDAVIVKPIDSFSGIGISICRSAQELEVATDLAKSISLAGEYIVEQFIEGSLHSCSLFMQDGDVKTSFFVDEFCFINQFQVSGSNSPSRLKQDTKNLVLEYISKIIEYLNYSDGLFHLQFIVKDDKPYFIEAMLRCPGDLFPNLIKLSKGINYTYYYLMSFIPGLADIMKPKSGFDIEKNFIWRETLAREVEFIYKGFSSTDSFNQIVDLYPLCGIGEVLMPAPKDKAGIVFSTVDTNNLNKIINNRGAYELYW